MPRKSQSGNSCEYKAFRIGWQACDKEKLQDRGLVQKSIRGISENFEITPQAFAEFQPRATPWERITKRNSNSERVRERETGSSKAVISGLNL